MTSGIEEPQPDYMFGPFRVYLAERRIDRDATPLRVGARAFDILAVLLDRAGDTVSKQEIAERVWPGIHVGETSLRVQIVGLRKLLADKDDDRVIATIPGRGYCFVGRVSRYDPAEGPAPALVEAPRARLPAKLAQIVGREREIADLCAMVEAHRFATVLGTGGIGKTTLAVSAAHDLSQRFAQDVCFVDLGSTSDARMVATTLSVALGLAVADADPIPALATFLRERRILVILDSCEHVVAAAADMAERLFHAAPGLHIIATSREALRADGEHVFVLSPFACPEKGASSVEQLLRFASARLLLERASAVGAPIEIESDDIEVVGEICRRLDGIPLAIELAAGRIPAYGLRGTAALLDDRFRYLHGGRRTAIPRHRTLSDTLGWSYELLDERARIILHRLTLFIGAFGPEAARAICDATIGIAETAEIIESLVAKSLLATHWSGGVVRYRLLDTTRAYLMERLPVSSDLDALRRRHAELFRDLAAPGSAKVAHDSDAERLPNLRAALAWAFGPQGDRALGVELSAAAAPLFSRLSLLTECRDICLRAIEALDERCRGSKIEMELQANLGQALMFTSGHTEEVERAFERALDLARDIGDQPGQHRLLGALTFFHARTADFGKALDFAESSLLVAERLGDPAGIAAAHCALGIAWHFLGRHREADLHLRPAMAVVEGLRGSDPTGFGFDHRNRACTTYARSLWIQGDSGGAWKLARDTVEESMIMGNPVTHCIALIGVISIAEWRENWPEMRGYVERLIAHAERHSLRPYLAVGLCMRGQLAIHSGKALHGVAAVSEHLATLRDARYEIWTANFMTAMAQGLLAAGELEEALATIGQCEAAVERNGNRQHTAELIRVRASILAAMGKPAEARAALEQALTCARAQAALAWELKCACDLVAGGHRDASLLKPIFSRLGRAEGDATWRRAHDLLAVAA